MGDKSTSNNNVFVVNINGSTASANAYRLLQQATRGRPRKHFSEYSASDSEKNLQRKCRNEFKNVASQIRAALHSWLAEEKGQTIHYKLEIKPAGGDQYIEAFFGRNTNTFKFIHAPLDGYQVSIKEIFKILMEFNISSSKYNEAKKEFAWTYKRKDLFDYIKSFKLELAKYSRVVTEEMESDNDSNEENIGIVINPIHSNVKYLEMYLDSHLTCIKDIYDTFKKFQRQGYKPLEEPMCSYDMDEFTRHLSCKSTVR